MSSAPSDVIFDILLLLPLKSVLRFKCVCKSVYAVIRSQSFTCKRASKKRKLISLQSDASTMDDQTSIVFRVFDFDNDLKPQFVFDQLVVSSNYYLIDNDYHIDHCNGLFAMYLGTISNRVLVWNPTTRQERILPPCPFKAIKDTYYNFRSLRRLAIGYDSIRDDYKIVALADMSSVWVFELKSSQWRRAHEDAPGYMDGYGSCFTDGALHFSYTESKNLINHEGYLYTDHSEKIVAFDVAKETFSMVAHPGKLNVMSRFSLHCFGGNLSIRISGNGKIQIYVRKKYGSDFRWIEIYPGKVTQFEKYLMDGKIIGYSGDENKILNFLDEKLYLRDLENLTIKQIEIEKNKNEKKRTSNLFLCSESYVSIEL